MTGVDLNGEFGGILITKAGKVQFNTILGVYEKSVADSSNNQRAATTVAAAATSTAADNLLPDQQTTHTAPETAGNSTAADTETGIAVIE